MTTAPQIYQFRRALVSELGKFLSNGPLSPYSSEFTQLLATQLYLISLQVEARKERKERGE